MKAPLKVRKDAVLDVAYVQLRKGKVTETIEVRPGILMDLDKNGELVGIEVLSIEKLAPLFETPTKRKSQRQVA